MIPVTVSAISVTFINMKTKMIIICFTKAKAKTLEIDQTKIIQK